MDALFDGKGFLDLCLRDICEHVLHSLRELCDPLVARGRLAHDHLVEVGEQSQCLL